MTLCICLRTSLNSRMLPVQVRLQTCYHNHPGADLMYFFIKCSILPFAYGLLYKHIPIKACLQLHSSVPFVCPGVVLAQAWIASIIHVWLTLQNKKPDWTVLHQSHIFPFFFLNVSFSLFLSVLSIFSTFTAVAELGQYSMFHKTERLSVTIVRGTPCAICMLELSWQDQGERKEVTWTIVRTYKNSRHRPRGDVRVHIIKHAQTAINIGGLRTRQPSKDTTTNWRR